MVDFIKRCFNFINEINPTVKTIIIMALLVWCTRVCLVKQGEVFVQNYIETVAHDTKKAEEYSLQMAPQIRQQIDRIQRQDTDATNVLLLSFHNTKKSLQGFSYMYLTALTEAPRGIDNDGCIEMWYNLPYIQYEDELTRIRRAGYLRIDSIENIKNLFPNLYKKLRQSGVNSAAFYPIEGMESPVGLVLVTYDKPKKYYLGYYNVCISPSIQVLSTILNYETVK